MFMTKMQNANTEINDTLKKNEISLV
jgi:hypothetical protein